MILKSCHRCGALIPYGSAYCSACQPIVAEEKRKKREAYAARSNKRYDKKRDPKYVKFYKSKDWKMLSQRYTQDKHFRCEQCGKIATEVHHIKPIQTPEGWNRRLDYTNLELLCVNCHNERHDRFRKKKRPLHPEDLIIKS